MRFTLFDLIMFATPQQSTRCGLIRKGKGGEVSDEAAQFVEDQILVCLYSCLELFILSLNDSFESFKPSLENILIAFRVKATFEEICVACLLFVQLLFPLLASEGIFDFQFQHVIDTLFPVGHVRPNAMII